MKVLFINHGIRGGGAEQFSYSLHASTENSAFLYKDDLKNLNLLDKAVQKFTRFNSWQHLLGFHESYHGTYKVLKRREEYLNADIIHLNNIHGTWFDISALAKIDLEKKIVWTLHDMWAITGGEAHTFQDQGYIHGEAKSPFIQNYPLNKPLIDNRKFYLRKKKKIYSALKNTTLVPVSSWLEDCVKKSYVYNSGLNIKLIKNGVDTATFINCKLRKSCSQKTLLFFNSNGPFKGSKNGLSALQKFQSEIDIWIVGERPTELKRYTHVANRIKDRKELAQIYNQVDILLFPSLAENMPLTVLEAMACGVVPIATAVGGIPEVVIPHRTGFLSLSTEPNDIQKALNNAISEDLSTLSEQATIFVHENHSFENMVTQYKKLYTSIINA